MNEPDNRISIDFSALKIESGEEDAETWLCDATDGPSAVADCGTQSSNELIEWLQGSTSNIDYRTRSALSRRIRNHASKTSPRMLNNSLNTVDEITPVSSPVPPVATVSSSTPRRTTVSTTRTRSDSGSASINERSFTTSPQHYAPKPNVNVKLRSNSRPPTAVVAPSKKAMTEPPRPATSLARRSPSAAMSTSFSQSNSRENSFQLSAGLMGDLYRSQISKATNFEDIENIAKMQEQALLKQLEMGVRERKSSFHNDTPPRPGTAEGYLATSRSVDFNSRLSPQPSVDTLHHPVSKLPVPKGRTGIPQPASRLPTPASKLKTTLRAVSGGSNDSPFSTPGVVATAQVQAIRRKSADLVKPDQQPLSVYEAPAGLAQSRSPLGHHYIVGSGRGNGSANGSDPDWHDECF